MSTQPQTDTTDRISHLFAGLDTEIPEVTQEGVCGPFGPLTAIQTYWRECVGFDWLHCRLAALATHVRGYDQWLASGQAPSPLLIAEGEAERHPAHRRAYSFSAKSWYDIAPRSY